MNYKNILKKCIYIYLFIKNKNIWSAQSLGDLASYLISGSL